MIQIRGLSKDTFIDVKPIVLDLASKNDVWR
jgi:hypothetical protein